MKQLTQIVFYSLLLLSCTKSVKISDSQSDSLHADTVHLQYAQGFEIINYPQYSELTVRDPWDEKSVFAKYYLVHDTQVSVPDNGVRVNVPVSNMAATSATHFTFLELLGHLDAVKGICSPDLIYNPMISQKWKEGKLTDLGDAFNINTEKSIAIQPQMVMMSGYKQDDPYAARLIQAGIPVVYNNEWMERTLLGRAEWIKFIAMFLDEEKKADSIFTVVSNKYLELKKMAVNEQARPKVLGGSNFRGTWYVPGGRSFMAQLFTDAGGDYYYANDTTRGSLPLQVEAVINKFAKADVWLNCNFESIHELVGADPKHDFFDAVHTGRVYNFNKRMLSSHANDYWETAVARPDILLKDVIKILHPDLLPDYDMYFAKKLKP